jgi:hypothetical protein
MIIGVVGGDLRYAVFSDMCLKTQKILVYFTTFFHIDDLYNV